MVVVEGEGNWAINKLENLLARLYVLGSRARDFTLIRVCVKLLHAFHHVIAAVDSAAFT